MSNGRPVKLGAAVVAAALALAVTGCASSQPKPEDDSNVTINVALFGSAPPEAALADFTKETGIKVNWTTIDWPSLQTKISTSATANSYFADVTDVDWSRVGQLEKLDWFYPIGDYLDTDSMKADMPQLNTFTVDGKVMGIPYDASFMVTTVNPKMLEAADANPAPTTIDEYTAALQKVKASGVAEYPLGIAFAALEGLSTQWYQTTAAFGGSVLDSKGAPTFTDPQSAGYKAATWMVDALESGLVAPGNINANPSEVQQNMMAKGQVASVFADYAGNVGTLYDVASSSSVVGDGIEYLPTPGVDGVGPNLSNPDALGIPRTAKYPEAAAKFIKWFTSAEVQATSAGLNGQEKAISGFFLPSSLSAIEQLIAKKALPGGEQLMSMLKSSQPVFPGGAPSWYSQFSNAVYTNLHSAAAGDQTVEAAMKAIASEADTLRKG